MCPTPEKFKNIDSDGLPFVGSFISKGDPLYCYVNSETQCVTPVYYTDAENAYVDQVKLLGEEFSKDLVTKASIVLRINRYPDVGDKFSSRHGQKGVCSMVYKTEDMPFLSANGIIPDIVFNPHGYPTRMTAGMLLETLAAKAGAEFGSFIDATAFKHLKRSDLDSKLSGMEFCQEILAKAGFDSLGTDLMFNGTDGKPIKVQIFCGSVYYQRLRHMVADKYQVIILQFSDWVIYIYICFRIKLGQITKYQ